MEKSGEELYEERLKRVQDALALRVPDQVPVAPMVEAFPWNYAGITVEEAMYDRDKAEQAFDKFLADFPPDLAWGPLLALPGEVFETLGMKLFKWPGHGVGSNRMYQIVEGEYMKADEYDHFIYDPTEFILTKYVPRIFGALKGLEHIPHIRDISYLAWLNVVPAFGMPEVQDALKTLMKAGEQLGSWFEWIGGYTEKMKEWGFPVAYGAFSWAPYDLLGDTLRGTHGVMTDMYRQPDKLHEAMEKILPIAVELGVEGCRATGVPYTWIWLHKAPRGFMSDEQFREFYWPGLRDLIYALVDEGLTPIVWSEGNYTERLKYLDDVPAGKVAYHFEFVDDLAEMEEILGDVACLFGNVPNSMLVSGTPQDVRDYCKQLIDVVGKNGGLIMEAAACVDEAKPENMKAMFEFTREYGVY